MLELFGFLYLLGAIIFLFGGLLSTKEDGESTLHHVVMSIGLAIFWLPGICLLVMFFIYWGIVGD